MFRVTAKLFCRLCLLGRRLPHWLDRARALCSRRLRRADPGGAAATRRAPPRPLEPPETQAADKRDVRFLANVCQRHRVAPWWATPRAPVATKTGALITLEHLSEVILIERPAETHVTEKGLLQRGDGPAAVYRDVASLRVERPRHARRDVAGEQPKVWTSSICNKISKRIRSRPVYATAEDVTGTGTF